ncbi:bifunctional hydroxymethylpyrimidine kinase/phosphomethylpyrimidine kinase [Sphingomonas sp. 28-63-12]|uniref:bifunctional hydroxymethylpyrimidine kinase/phosphomethylpyrimidine kinase n=1 Tax=Sphingomonas sp. 28-63-12 TaxID=1970434 RepID=UPI000BDDBC6A|nr:MAG: bifunctional hydroxymethylpyrimidine kinase/phosphomethylpyrimidine kinase [Sphingomonas sp. 28-63-12]
MTPRILIIAGSDSGGGAGIQADIKTVTMLGGHAMTAITAITAQNTLGVQAVHPVPAEMVIAQIESVVSDIGVDAVKIGMLGSAATAHAVADYLDKLSSSPSPHLNGRGLPLPIVFDPVMVATSGDALADGATVAAFERLMAIATLVTPNRPELDILGGAERLLSHAKVVLAKGGHDDGDSLTDALIDRAGARARWSAPRIDSTSTHGTGCTLASAIATYLAYGYPIDRAIGEARAFVRIAIKDAPGLGGGHGPMGHGRVRLDARPGARLNQVTVAMAAGSAEFYRLLGLIQIVDTADGHYARFEATGGATLSVETGAAATVFFECDDLDGEVARLQAAGIVVDQLPTDQSWLWREARLRDPAGNAICLYQAGENRRFPPWRLVDGS